MNLLNYCYIIDYSKYWKKVFIIKKNKILSFILSVLILANLCSCSKVYKLDNTSVSSQLTNQLADSKIECYFPRANQDAEKALLNIIDSSKSTLDVSIYSITNNDIVNAIIGAKQRMVDVKVITDKTESKGKTQKNLLQHIKNAGIPIKEDSHKGIMHLKVTIADNQVVTTGSYNYTESAEKYNDEVLVVIHNKNTVNQFSQEFESMWNDNKNFKDY